MKQIAKYSAAALLLALAWMGCKQETVSPEEVLRQYQAHIDKNEFEAAAKLSTPANQLWLDELAKIIAGEKEEDSVLNTKFLNINSEGSGDTLQFNCMLQDQFEVYSAAYRLVRIKGQWLVDAPQEDAFIEHDFIDNIPDSLLEEMLEDEVIEK